MNTTTHSSPKVLPLPQADAPLERVVPTVDLLRGAEDAIGAIRIDCLFAPDEYLTEVLAPGGGE